MQLHNLLRLLINSMEDDEKNEFQKSKELPDSISQLFLLVSEKNYFTTPAATKKLALSNNAYKHACTTLYNCIISFFLKKNSVENLHSSNYDNLLIKIFIERGLYDIANNYIEKNILIARDKNDIQAEVLFLQKHLQNISFLADEDLALNVPAILKRLSTLNDDAHQFLMLSIIYTKLVNLRYKMALRTSEEQQQEILIIQKQLNQFSLKKIKYTLSLILYYQCDLFAEYMLGSNDKITHYNLLLLKCWQDKPHLVDLYPEFFIRSVSIQAYTHFFIKDIVAVQYFMETYSQLVKNNLSSKFYKKWFAIVEFHTTSKILHKTYQYDELSIFFNNNWKAIYNSSGVLRASERLDLLVSASISFFVLQQWQLAENYIQKSKEINLKVNRIDTLYFTFVFHCLILYEQKEWSRLNSLINSGYHFLYSHKNLMPFEKDMLLFIKKMPTLMLRGHGVDKMKTFLEKLETYKEHKIKKLHFAYFDFYGWIQSKIEGVSYRQHMLMQTTKIVN